ncbi:MAG TPA: response regulator [Bacteriovoracaceae bacterium]|nr:response regulator [Bacteriovoracaceae bacterium]
MRRWRIVYFDDNECQIDVLKDTLCDRFNLTGTSDISKYEELLEQNPDLILIDVHMPGIDGFELFELVKKSHHYNDCPIVFISGDISPENQLKSHKLGADDFLTRDLELSELSARLVNKIKLHRRSALKITIDNLSLDLEMFCVYVNEDTISLTLNELKVLGVILRKFPKVCNRATILNQVWGAGPVKPAIVNSHMSVLNSKLRDWTYELKFKKDQVFVVKKEL